MNSAYLLLAILY